MKDELRVIENMISEKLFDQGVAIIPIDEAIKFLNDAKSKGAVKLKVHAKADYEGDIENVSFEAFYETVETEEEKNKRLEAEKEFDRKFKLITLRYNQQI